MQGTLLALVCEVLVWDWGGRMRWKRTQSRFFTKRMGHEQKSDICLIEAPCLISWKAFNISKRLTCRTWSRENTKNIANKTLSRDRKTASRKKKTQFLNTTMTSLIIFHQWDLGKYSMPCRSTLSVFIISATTQNKHTLMLLMEYSCKRMDFFMQSDLSKHWRRMFANTHFEQA